MFLFLSKLLPAVLFPISLAAVLMVGALLVRKERLRKWLILIAFLLIWVLGNGWVSGLIVRSLERRYLPQVSYPAVDAIVLLGGGTEPAEFPRRSVGLNVAGDRLLHTAELYREGRAPVVIVTAGNLPWTDAMQTPADDMAAILDFLGVPGDAVIIERQSYNTYENALYTNEILKEMGAKDVLLVTSAMHMPRAFPLFERHGVNVIPAPTDYRITSPPAQKSLAETWPDYLIGLFPSAEAFNNTTLALKEYIGIGVYTLRGWN